MVRNKVMLTPDELARYDRQLLIRGIGQEGQEKLKQAKIVIAGMGALGSAASNCVVSAGFGTVRLIDCDRVEAGNLNRQFLYTTEDIGKRKVKAAAEKLKSLNPMTDIDADDEMITEDNVLELVSGFDLIVDALDNLSTRFILNKAAIKHGIPLMHGAVHAFEGRAMTVIPGKTACLKCIYRGIKPEEKIPVIGTSSSVIGSIQVTEAIKYIVGTGKLLEDRILVYDGLNMHFTELETVRNPDCPHCSSVD